MRGTEATALKEPVFLAEQPTCHSTQAYHSELAYQPDPSQAQGDKAELLITKTNPNGYNTGSFSPVIYYRDIIARNQTKHDKTPLANFTFFVFVASTNIVNKFRNCVGEYGV